MAQSYFCVPSVGVFPLRAFIEIPLFSFSFKIPQEPRVLDLYTDWEGRGFACYNVKGLSFVLECQKAFLQ